MPTPRPKSFRRILILRLLLIGIPILLLGQYVTMRKGRTSLLETARENLASSAVRKAESLSQIMSVLQGNLLSVAQMPPLQTGELATVESEIAPLTLNTDLIQTCFQVNQGKTAAVVFSNCAAEVPLPLATLPWNDGEPAIPQNFYLAALGSPQTPSNLSTTGQHTHLEVVMAAPVYDTTGALKYTLSLRAELTQLENTGPGSLVGHTVIIDEMGTILVHPDPTFRQKSIDTVPGSDRLHAILRGSQNDRSDTLHLFNFLPQQSEWLAGYNGLTLPIAPGKSRRFAVLAVTPLDNALQGLEDIRGIIVLFTLGLLITQVLLVLYLARHLSRPIEKLCQHAQDTQDLADLQEVPQNFQVWELNRLAQVLNRMLKRLEQRTQEIHHAWQDAQMANELKSEFLANTSHELRTPLNAIIGCIRLIKDGCCDSEEEVKEFLDRADQAAIHLLGIINDILDIAKIESGTVEIQPEPMDLRPLIEEVVDLQTLHAEQKGLRLIAAPLPTPLWVMADRSKLKQVLINIVYNAVKFTEVGEVVIQAAIHQPMTNGTQGELPLTLPPGVDAPTPPPRVVVAIADTGIGIDPKQQEKLFQPFVMADGSTTRRFEGTGLGLAISRNLMTLMAGSITLHSEGLGKGTCVILALPLLETEEAGASRTPTDRALEPNLSLKAPTARRSR